MDDDSFLSRDVDNMRKEKGKLRDQWDFRNRDEILSKLLFNMDFI